MKKVLFFPCIVSVYHYLDCIIHYLHTLCMHEYHIPDSGRIKKSELNRDDVNKRSRAGLAFKPGVE